VFWCDLGRQHLIGIAEQHAAALRDRIAHSDDQRSRGVNRLRGREDGSVDHWPAPVFGTGFVSAQPGLQVRVG
jgi:hypothetical protein